MLAIGIDPGTVRTGYGVVRKDGGRLVCVGSGTIRADESAPMEQRLLTIHRQLDTLLTTYGPDAAGVEDVFFAKNARTSLKLGQVRGVIMVTLAARDVPQCSYPPALVKRAIVGAGRASKEQIGRIVQAILGLSQIPQVDEGDALAIAICHLNAPPIPTKGVSGRRAPYMDRLKPAVRRG